MAARMHYGWLIAAVTFLAFVLTVGITQYAFGVFITELEADLGWTRTEISAAISFFAVAGLTALPIGWLIDRIGARPVMAASLAMLAVSQLLRPWMTDVWHLYALSAIQFAAMPGAVLITAGRLVGLWFETGRGLAMGLTAMGANVGGFIFASLTAVLIGAIGWESTYFVYGLLFVALVPVVLIVVREPDAYHAAKANPSAEAHHGEVGLTAADALRSRTFYVLTLGLVLAQLTYGGVLPQVVPHLESVGISRGQAAAALSLLAVFGACGKVSFGWLTEKRPSRYVVALCLVFQVVGLTGLIAAGSSPLFWVSIPVFGLGFGALGALMPLVVQETFGLRAYGTIFGAVQLVTLSAALTAPLFAGASFDATGSYRLAFGVFAALFVCAAIVISFARPPAQVTVEAAPIPERAAV